MSTKVQNVAQIAHNPLVGARRRGISPAASVLPSFPPTFLPVRPLYPSRTRSRRPPGRTDGRTDGRADGQTIPPNLSPGHARNCCAIGVRPAAVGSAPPNPTNGRAERMYASLPPSLPPSPPLCVLTLTLTWTIAYRIGGRGGENLLKGESENRIMHA